jgi:hypothetical protein
MQRIVMIGTPCYDGKVTVQYANSLKETLLLGVKLGINIVPVYMAGNALIQQARNNLFALAIKHKVDDLFFIDSDVEWNESWIFKLLNYKEHIIGATYRKKMDTEEKYAVNIKDLNNVFINKTNPDLIEVDGLGLGFCKIDNYALNKIWSNSQSYKDEDNEEKRSIFNVEIKDGKLLSEDISFFYNWNNLEEKTYLDITMTCNHIGVKTFQGNFLEYLNKLKKELK